MRRYIYLILVTMLMVSCYKEKTLTTSERVQVDLFEFPQGNDPWDKEIEQIYKDYGVKFIYKDFSPAKFNTSWAASENENEYIGSDLTEEQIRFSLDFWKNEIFKYITPQIGKGCFPDYIYMCYDAFRLQKEQFAFPLRLSVNNPGFWISCFEGTLKLDGPTRDSIDLPVTNVLRREARGRILQRIFCMATMKGNILPPPEIAVGGLIDYTTPLRISATIPVNIDLTDPTVKHIVIDDPNLCYTRGIPPTLASTFYTDMPKYADADKFRKRDFGPITTIGTLSPQKVLWDYLNTIMRFSDEELGKGYVYGASRASWSVPPLLKSRHPLLYKVKDIVIQYMKEKYNIDLLEIYEAEERINQ